MPSLTVIAVHNTLPMCPSPDEQTLTMEQVAAHLKANHGVPGDWKSMTLRSLDGQEFRAWFGWRATARRQGTMFQITTAAGTALHTIQMPAFYYPGTR